jgi:hypothetical protein
LQQKGLSAGGKNNDFGIQTGEKYHLREPDSEKCTKNRNGEKDETEKLLALGKGVWYSNREVCATKEETVYGKLF